MPVTNGQHRIVIVGGGFAGLKCAVDLAPHRDLSITLLDRNNYQQFQPLLYQVATSILSPTNAAFALRDILRDYPNVDVQMDEALSIDLNQRTVTTASGNTHTADTLVLATGSRVNFFNTPGAEQHSFPLYTLRDAENLRDTILKALEKADNHPPAVTNGALTFVIVGGGPTGVEMAGTLSDTLQQMLHNEYRNIAQPAQVYLIEQGPAVLAMFSPESRDYAAKALQEHGVQLRLRTSVVEVTPESVKLSDSSAIPTRTVIWAAGLKASTPTLTPDPARLPNGRILIKPDLTLANFPSVYVLGDIANSLDHTGESLPQLAAVAKQAGQHCAQNILATLKGKSTTAFVYSDRGIVAMIGRDAGVTELGSGHHELTGPVAFAAWLGIHAALLTVARARMEAIIEWAWNYFTREHSGQLIDR
jgi:NADH:ubiquinone reductase (H+-translocating)